MNGYLPSSVNFSGVQCQITASQGQNAASINPLDTDFDTLARIFLLFPELRKQFVARLHEWKLILTYKQPMSTLVLANHLTSLADHMNKCFLKPEVLRIASLPLCYSRRVNSIITVIWDIIPLLKNDPNHLITDPEFIAGVLGMILVQIGRLCISEDITSDETVTQMDQLAAVIDAQVSIEAYASVATEKVREQRILKDLWARMHITDSACSCEQCKTAKMAGLMVTANLEDQMVDDAPDGEIIDLTADDMIGFCTDVDFMDLAADGMFGFGTDVDFMDLAADGMSGFGTDVDFMDLAADGVIGVCTDEDFMDLAADGVVQVSTDGDSMDCGSDEALDLESMDILSSPFVTLVSDADEIADMDL